MTFGKNFLEHAQAVIAKLDDEAIENSVNKLVEVRARYGRLFIIGSGGGAAYASHATCDFRKMCNIEAYAPYDNVCELTARVNDDGWGSTLTKWLQVSRLSSNDCILIFSVGGGDLDKNISVNIVNATVLAKKNGATVIGIVGKDGGFIRKEADVSIIIPELVPELVTPLTEGLQPLIWHLMVSHPRLLVNTAKWEGLASK